MQNKISEEIIVIEDNDTMRLGITESLQKEGYTVSAFDNGVDALNNFKVHSCAMAVIDLKMEPLNGIEVLKQIKEQNPKTEVLMISAYGTVEDAVKAMQLGAADFLTKPFSPDELRIRVRKLFERRQKEKEIENLIEQNRFLNEEIQTEFKDIIGSSKAIKNVFSLIDQVAGKDSTVLLLGESGTGKELVARAIHRKSKRADKPFIKVNCGVLNENLLESELFGHEKGSFTGAVRQKKGRFELADTGTLFLDEIGDISTAMQIKLLRVLQEGEFERVGGEQTIHTDVRIISATNRHLQKLVMQEKFREDLFYRLSVIPVQLPPLRERKEDIVPLVDYFLNKLSARNRQASKKISDDGLKLLVDYPWPGNIRELENLIERLFVISHGDEIAPELIASHLSSGLNNYNSFANLPLVEAVGAFEKKLIVQAMKKSDGVKNRAAKLLGINTSALYYKLEKYDLL